MSIVYPTFKKILPRTATIFNPTEQPGKPVYLDVPVNANHFNRNKMQRDWTFRTYVEWRASVSSFFTTLTFNEFHIPRMEDGTLCFRKDIVEPFIRRLRDRLANKYGIPRGSMKYFLVSEYGKTTHRPHHHCMFFFRTFVAYPVFSEVLQWSWRYGFVGCEVPESNRVLSYVSKYVTKDVYSFDGDVAKSKDDPDVSQERTVYNFATHSFDSYKVTKYNFHLQSVGFGSDFEKYITHEQWLKGTITVCLDGQTPVTFSIPKYYCDRMLRKLEYYRDDNGKRHAVSHVTELGKEVHVARVQHNADSLIELSESLIRDADKYIDNYGLDVADADVDLSFVVSKLSPEYRLATPRDTLIDYMLNKRYRPFNELEGKCNLRFDVGKPVFGMLWNELYRPLEQWLLILNDVRYIVDKYRQRFEEREEYRRYVSKRRRGGRIY